MSSAARFDLRRSILVADAGKTAAMPRPSRRAILAAAAFATAARGQPKDLAMPSPSPTAAASTRLTCFIRYQIDPFQKEAFRAYAEAWGRIIPRCGGHLVGYFLPDEGTNDVAWGLIAFDSLASYEAYRARLRLDPEGRANFEMAQQKRLVLREERTFLETVAGTFDLAPR